MVRLARRGQGHRSRLSEVQAFRFVVPAVVGARVGVWSAMPDRRDPFRAAVGLAAVAVTFAVADLVLGWWAGRSLDRIR